MSILSGFLLLKRRSKSTGWTAEPKKHRTYPIQSSSHRHRDAQQRVVCGTQQILFVFVSPPIDTFSTPSALGELSTSVFCGSWLCSVAKNNFIPRGYETFQFCNPGSSWVFRSLDSVGGNIEKMIHLLNQRAAHFDKFIAPVLFQISRAHSLQRGQGRMNRIPNCCYCIDTHPVRPSGWLRYH